MNECAVLNSQVAAIYDDSALCSNRYDVAYNLFL